MKLNLLKEKLVKGDFNERFKEIYITNDLNVQKEVERYSKALDEYEKLFGDQDIAIYSAPGRTEVGGNHTDHQHGKVLAAAVNMDAIAVVGRNDSNQINMRSEGYEVPSIDLCDLTDKQEERFTTESLIRGVSAKFKAEGYNIGGFNAYCTSNVLKGSGISSSAAFEVLIGVILNHEFNDAAISPIEIAQIAQFSENVYFGKPCGLMDQTTCAVGGL